MKKTYTVLLLGIIFLNVLIAQEGIQFRSNFNPYPSTGYNDIWGYSADGREYALLCVNSGTSIIDITDPENPAEIDFISGPLSGWRDVKVHDTYAYVVTEGTSGNHGLQIIDLSDLPNSASLVKNTTQFFERAHNIFIDNGFAYVIGTNNSGGMHILDLTDPENPVETAYYTASGYVHDVYVWSDTVIACSEDTYDLVDVTDKNNPAKISSSVALPGIYAHSGWMTEDKRYFIAAEEFNQLDITVWDLQDRTNWQLVVEGLKLSDNTPVHNIFVRDNYAHISYYKEGYVVFDISDPAMPVLVAQYDTYPSSQGYYSGAWGCFPYFPSGNVIISDMSTGLYVFSFSPVSNPAPFLTPQLVGEEVVAQDSIELKMEAFDDGAVAEAYLYYRTTHEGSTSDWNSLIDLDGPVNNTYNFFIPPQEHLTTVEYYFAAEDDSGKVSTSPSGGSGTPAGSIPPGNFYSYLTIYAGVPVITSLSPVFADTTITTDENIDFFVEAHDTTNHEITYSWYVGKIKKGFAQNYSYRSKLGEVPRTDTLTLIVTNSFKSVEKQWIISVENPTSADDPLNLVYELKQNYPNPFNPSTRISYSIPEASNVQLKVFNSLGQLVKILVDNYQSKGNYEIEFSAEGLSSGFYIAQLSTDKFSRNIKMLMLK